MCNKRKIQQYYHLLSTISFSLSAKYIADKVSFSLPNQHLFCVMTDIKIPRLWHENAQKARKSAYNIKATNQIPTNTTKIPRCKTERWKYNLSRTCPASHFFIISSIISYANSHQILRNLTHSFIKQQIEIKKDQQRSKK